MIEEKLIIVILSRAENITANVTFMVVWCISHWRFSVFSLTEDISISRAHFYLQYNHRETRAINPTEAGPRRGRMKTVGSYGLLMIANWGAPARSSYLLRNSSKDIRYVFHRNLHRPTHPSVRCAKSPIINLIRAKSNVSSYLKAVFSISVLILKLQIFRREQSNVSFPFLVSSLW